MWLLALCIEIGERPLLPSKQLCSAGNHTTLRLRRDSNPMMVPGAEMRTPLGVLALFGLVRAVRDPERV